MKPVDEIDMQGPFFATIKLITGEEVLAEVMHELDHETNDDFFTVANPITVTEMTKIDHQRGVMVSGLVPKKWMAYSANDDLTIIHKQHVISISELDKFTIDFYRNALKVAKVSSPIKRSIKSEDNTGYVGKVDKSRDDLERIFNR
jgi:hypothetical protein